MYVFKAEYVMKQIENGDTNWIKDGVEYSGGCILGLMILLVATPSP